MASRLAGMGGAIRAEWRDRWRVGAAVTCAIGLGYTVWASVASLFVEPLQREFGWSRGEIAFSYYAALIGGFFAPVIGMMVDRFGARRVLLAGLAIVASCYGLLAILPGALPIYYSIWIVIGTAGLATTAISTTRVINGAFITTRGFALAITRAGLALSAAILPAVLYVVIDAWGFRAGFALLGLLILLLPLPICWRWLPHRGTEPSQPVSEPQVARPPVRKLLRNPLVLRVCLAAALNYAPVIVIMSQLKPLGVAKGLPDDLAVLAVSVLGLASFAGALLSGLLVDRFWAPGVAFTLNILGAIGCLVLFTSAPPVPIFLLGVALIGFGQGAEIDIVAFIVARWFGLANYSTIYGLTVFGIGLTGPTGAILIGAGYDAYGNYQLALALCAGSFCLAALTYLSLGRPPEVSTASVTAER